MKKILEQVAELIIDKCGNKSLQTVIVLPNKRSCVFLKDYLLSKVGRPFWIPDMLTVDELIIDLSRFELLDPIELNFELFEIHQKIAGEKHRNLEDFLSWAPVMLADFNDIDLYLADANTVFTHLSAIKAIGEWKLDQGELTEMQKNYLDFFESLSLYYEHLNHVLKNNNQGYKGLIYRLVTENLEVLFQARKWTHFIVVGLNALSTSEKKIFNYIHQNYQTDFLWDTDDYYMNPESPGNKTAGRFIKEMSDEWKIKELNWIGENFKQIENRHINIIGVPKNIGQVKYTGELLQKSFDGVMDEPNLTEKKARETAVVLADENLLVPLLNSLPKIEKSDKNIVGYNITMGYPIRFGLFSQFIEQWLEMQIRMTENNQKKFSAKQILYLLNSPALNLFLNNSGIAEINRVSGKIKHNNNPFLSLKEVLQSTNPDTDENSIALLNLLLVPGNSMKDFILSVESLFKLFFGVDSDNNVKIDFIVAEELKVIRSIIKRLLKYSERDTEVSLKAFQKILIQLFKRAEITLKGEPLNGIQIMGLLETRNLDFKNVILLSANEGLLPRTDSTDSFIPFELRHLYHLPLPKEKIDVFAYHFYRLIQRTENLTIMYNSEPGNLGGGEVSRFVQQLKYELKTYNQNISISETYLTSSGESATQSQSIVIPKNDEVTEAIKTALINGLSPSALNNFIVCPLKYYFINVLKLKPLETIDDSIESDVFGTIIHQILEEIYRLFRGNVLDSGKLKLVIGQADELVKKAFIDYFGNSNFESGKSLLIFEVAKKYITQFIIDDIVRITSKIELIDVEKEVFTYLETDGLKIKLKGIIDRVEKDIQTNLIQIIDYKTGKVEQKDIQVKDWTDLLEKQEKSKALQLLYYAYIFAKNSNPGQAFQASIFSLRNRSAGLISLQLPDEKLVSESLEEIETVIKNIVTKILDKNIPFTQVEDSKKCEWCDFKSVCNR